MITSGAGMPIALAIPDCPSRDMALKSFYKKVFIESEGCSMKLRLCHAALLLALLGLSACGPSPRTTVHSQKPNDGASAGQDA